MKELEMVKYGKRSGYGQEESKDVGVSAQSAPIVVDAPYVTQVNDHLTCTMGNWDETATPDSFEYQWKSGGMDIEGATSAEYALDTSDVGSSFSCTLTAVNIEGSTPAESNSVEVEDFVPTAPGETPPVDMDAPKTYVALEDNVTIEMDDGTEQTFNKGDEAQISMNRARELIDSGVRIVGTD
jgi:hypothetical protein